MARKYPKGYSEAVVLVESLNAEGQMVRSAWRISAPVFSIDSYYGEPAQAKVTGRYRGGTIWKGEWPSDMDGQAEIEAPLEAIEQ